MEIMKNKRVLLAVKIILFTNLFIPYLLDTAFFQNIFQVDIYTIETNVITLVTAGLALSLTFLKDLKITHNYSGHYVLVVLVLPAIAVPSIAYLVINSFQYPDPGATTSQYFWHIVGYIYLLLLGEAYLLTIAKKVKENMDLFVFALFSVIYIAAVNYAPIKDNSLILFVIRSAYYSYIVY